MLASYTSGQSSYPRKHPACWASLQWSHIVSSTPSHGAWTSAPLSVHLSIEWERTESKIETPICTHCTTFLLTTIAEVRRSQPITDGMRKVGEHYETPYFHPHPTLMERSCQEEPGSGSTASAPVSCVFVHFCTNGIWPLLRLVSVAQKIKQLTMLSSNVQCIDLPMEHGLTVLDDETIDWLLNTCPRSSAAKQWSERTGSNNDGDATCASVL